MLLHQFGQDLVLALEFVLEGSDLTVLGVFLGLAVLAGILESSSAVLEELLLPEIEEVDTEVVLLADVGDRLFLQEVESGSKATFSSGAKWRRCLVMDVPPRVYSR